MCLYSVGIIPCFYGQDLTNRPLCDLMLYIVLVIQNLWGKLTLKNQYITPIGRNVNDYKTWGNSSGFNVLLIFQINTVYINESYFEGYRIVRTVCYYKDIFFPFDAGVFF